MTPQSALDQTIPVWRSDIQAGRYADASRALRDHLRTNPSDTGAQTELALSLVLAGAFREALSVAAKVVAEHPSNIDAGLCLSRALMELGFETEARAQMSALVALGCPALHMALLQMRMDELADRFDAVLMKAGDLLRQDAMSADAWLILNRAFLTYERNGSGERMNTLVQRFGLGGHRLMPRLADAPQDIDLLVVCDGRDAVFPLDGFGGPGLQDISTVRLIGRKPALTRAIREAHLAGIPRLAIHPVRAQETLGAALNAVFSAVPNAHFGLMTTDVLASGHHLRALSKDLSAAPLAGMATALNMAVRPQDYESDPFRDGARHAVTALSVICADLAANPATVAGFVPFARSGLSVICRQSFLSGGGFDLALDDLETLLADFSLRLTTAGVGLVQSGKVVVGRPRVEPQGNPALARLAGIHTPDKLLLADLLVRHSRQVRVATAIVGRGRVYA